MIQEDMIELLLQKVEKKEYTAVKEILTKMKDSELEEYEIYNQDEKQWKELMKHINHVLEEKQ